MKSPRARGGRETAARTASRAAGRRRYPFGKALARIRYVERQRGTSQTRYVAGHVITEPLLKVGARTGARRGGRPGSRVPYSEAAAKKLRLEPPNFSAAANLPVWRELGPTF